jgi:hypothetical protein
MQPELASPGPSDASAHASRLPRPGHESYGSCCASATYCRSRPLRRNAPAMSAPRSSLGLPGHWGFFRGCADSHTLTQPFSIRVCRWVAVTPAGKQVESY